MRGRPEKFCNISCWIVEPDHRTQGLLLLFELLKCEDTTFTCLTGTKVAPILKRFGFRRMDERSKILFPVPHLALICGCNLQVSPQEINSAMDAQDLQIFHDHLPFQYPHLLVDAHDSYSYLIVKNVKRKRLPVTEVHYLSHPEVFLRHAPHILPRLCQKMKSVGVLIGEHYLQYAPYLWSITIPQRIPRLFRSSRLGIEQMDTIYSELQILNL